MVGGEGYFDPFMDMGQELGFFDSVSLVLYTIHMSLFTVHEWPSSFPFRCRSLRCRLT